MSSFAAPDALAAPTPRPLRYLSVGAVALRLECDPTTVRRLLKRGLFPNAFQLAPGGKSRWRVPLGDLEAHLAKVRAPVVPVLPAVLGNPPAEPGRAMAGPPKARRMAT